MRALAAFLLAAASPSAEPAPVLVFPFEMQPAEAAWVGEYVADDLPRILAAAGVAAIPRPDRLAAHDAVDLPASPVSRATAIRLAEALGADRIVLGTGQVSGGSLRLEARIVDVERGTLSSPITVSGPLENLTDLTFSLAWDVALAGPNAPRRSKTDVLQSRPRRSLSVLRSYGQALTTPDTAARLGLLGLAVGAAPDFAVARLELARLRLDGRDFEMALRELAPITSASPARREAEFLRSAALLGLGRFEEADKLLLALATAEPSPGVFSNRGLALLGRGTSSSSTRASDLLRQANALVPGSTDITFNLGYSLFIEGEIEASIFWLRGLRELDPEDDVGRAVLSWALRRAGRAGEADQEWKAVSDAPSLTNLRSPDSSRRLGRILVSEHPFALDPARRDNAVLAAAHHNRGAEALAAGDVDTAFRELSRAAYLNPFEPTVHRSLARLHQRRGDLENAAAELQTSLWCAEDVGARVDLMRLLQQMGRIPEARSHAQRILRVDPNNEAARELLPSGSL